MGAERGRGKGGFRAGLRIIGGAMAPPAPPVARPLVAPIHHLVLASAKFSNTDCIKEGCHSAIKKATGIKVKL